MVSDLYSELFHYTGALGLEGILSSGTLRATNIGYLNDVQEFRLFFESRLPRLIAIAASKAYQRLSPHELHFQVGRYPQEEEYVRKMVDGLLPIITTNFAALGQPYVTSLCAHTKETLIAHGLLSQWRGYGPDGGYALVFDTLKLEDLLRAESNRWPGMPLLIANVEYFDNPGESDPKQDEQLGAEQTLVNALVDMLAFNKGERAIMEMAQPIHLLASTAKHWGFTEEQEVRIVMSVPSPEFSGSPPSPPKPVHCFLRGGTPVPYLSLFAELPNSAAGRLPLKRVIVGPHRDADKRSLSTELLLRAHGYADVPVHVSAIPYRGHG